MSRVQQFGFVLGTALVVGGFAVVFVPEIASSTGANSMYLTAIALVALLGGGMVVYARLTASDSRIELPTPERKHIYSTPGDEFDRQLASLTPRGRRKGMRERRAVRDRLDEIAISVLVRDGDSEARARERLVDGTWTDDPHAAAFFAEENASDIPLEDRLRVAFSTEPSSRKRARHAIDALARIAGEGE